MKSTLPTLIAALLVAGSPVQLWAQVTSPPRDLTRVSIEDLLNIEITSAAKKEQRAEDVPAAVFVITQDDIRRSGLRSLPELFRLVPGMQGTMLDTARTRLLADSVFRYGALLAADTLDLEPAARQVASSLSIPFLELGNDAAQRRDQPRALAYLRRAYHLNPTAALAEVIRKVETQGVESLFRP